MGLGERSAETPAEARAGRAREWRTGILLLLCSTLLCLGLLEVASRGFWSLSFGVPFRDPGRILYAYYPELARVDRKRPTHDDGFYDVLFLGGSVLNSTWGAIEQALLEQLAYSGHRSVRIFNVAMAAHTSRDSRLKYAALGGNRFDLVVFYHGVNDARANNAPPEVFREDYGHYAWYEIVNTLAPYHGTASLALPYTLKYLAVLVRQATQKARYVPRERPRAEWVAYGGDVRTAASFESNLQSILRRAAARADRVMLMTFVTYVPANYTEDAFLAKRLDYGVHLGPIEDWGRPEYVLKAVGVHNDIVRNAAASHRGVLYVDQAQLMAGSAQYFNDFCHFTILGSSRFAENMVKAMLAAPETR